MVCFARRFAEASSSVLFHVVEYCPTVDTGEGEGEGKNFGSRLVDPNGDAARYVSCSANKDLSDSLCSERRLRLPLVLRSNLDLL